MFGNQAQIKIDLRTLEIYICYNIVLNFITLLYVPFTDFYYLRAIRNDFRKGKQYQPSTRINRKTWGR